MAERKITITLVLYFLSLLFRQSGFVVLSLEHFPLLRLHATQATWAAGFFVRQTCPRTVLLIMDTDRNIAKQEKNALDEKSDGSTDVFAHNRNLLKERKVSWDIAH